MRSITFPLHIPPFSQAPNEAVNGRGEFLKFKHSGKGRGRELAQGVLEGGRKKQKVFGSLSYYSLNAQVEKKKRIQ